MEDTIVHEMIHAFDHCRFDVKWLDLRHHACSEVCRNALRLQRIRIDSRYYSRSEPQTYLETANGHEKSVVDSTHSQNSIR
jgi:hypothetical protein